MGTIASGMAIGGGVDYGANFLRAEFARSPSAVAPRVDGRVARASDVLGVESVMAEAFVEEDGVHASGRGPWTGASTWQ